MAITNIEKSVLNERNIDTGYKASYHVVSAITESKEGVSFSVFSYKDENTFLTEKGESIRVNFFASSADALFPFSESEQKQTNVTLKSLIEDELLKNPESTLESMQKYPYRGYLKGGTKV